MRDISREQLSSAVTDRQFNTQMPSWDKLPADVRETKVAIAREEVLKVLNRAGYQVRKKVRDE